MPRNKHSKNIAKLTPLQRPQRKKGVAANLVTPDELKELGNLAFTEKNFEDATHYYSQAISMDPNNHLLWSNRSASHASMNEYLKAAEDAEECIRLSPEFIKGYYRLATAQAEMKNFRGALKAIDDGLQMDVQHAPLLKLQASVLERQQVAAVKQQQQQQQRTKSAVRRRPLCRFFVLHGNCRYGEDCAYSHTLPEGGVVEARKQIPCPYFLRGTCKYGDYCQLGHDSQFLNTAATTIRNSKPPPAATFSDEYATQQHYSKPRPSSVCGICLTDPTSIDDSTTVDDDDAGNIHKKFGLLSCCNHVFCFDCLMKWRQQGAGTERRSCPTCRKHSDYVVPSVVLPTDGKDKERIVTAYKTKLALIPCKRFDGTLGSCPFGRDCFFAHRTVDGIDIKAQDETMKELMARRDENRRRRRRRGGGGGRDNMEDFFRFLYLLDLAASRGGFDGFYDDHEDDDDEEWGFLDMGYY